MVRITPMTILLAMALTYTPGLSLPVQFSGRSSNGIAQGAVADETVPLRQRNLVRPTEQRRGLNFYGRDIELDFPRGIPTSGNGELDQRDVKAVYMRKSEVEPELVARLGGILGSILGFNPPPPPTTTTTTLSAITVTAPPTVIVTSTVAAPAATLAPPPPPPTPAPVAPAPAIAPAPAPAPVVAPVPSPTSAAIAAPVPPPPTVPAPPTAASAVPAPAPVAPSPQEEEPTA